LIAKRMGLAVILVMFGLTVGTIVLEGLKPNALLGIAIPTTIVTGLLAIYWSRQLYMNWFDSLQILPVGTISYLEDLIHHRWSTYTSLAGLFASLGIVFAYTTYLVIILSRWVNFAWGIVLGILYMAIAALLFFLDYKSKPALNPWRLFVNSHTAEGTDADIDSITVT
ncbi:MAG: hypothetical protein AAF639_47470, partial [Chloroflexota bacterium]